MSRTTTKQISPTSVLATFTDDDGTSTTETYSVNPGGGTVRNSRGEQVCEYLLRVGPTLSSKDGDELLKTIRREQKRWRAKK